MLSAEWFTHQPKWSAAEKKTARRAFDQAYQRKCGDIAAQVKKMAARSSGYLLREGWLTEADLAGLHQDKIEKIKRWANL